MNLYRRLVFIVAAWLILTAGAPLPAKTLTFDAEKCHIDVPDDWTQRQEAGSALAIINADQTKSLVLRITVCGDDILVDNPDFLQGVEKTMAGNGFTVTDRQPATVAGVAARTLDATQKIANGTVYNRMTIVLANGNAYAVFTSKLGTPPWQDDQLNASLNSFGFIGTPALHHQGQTRSDRVAYLMGQLFGTLIAVLASFSIVKWIRNRKT